MPSLPEPGGLRAGAEPAFPRATAFRRALDEKLELAEVFAEGLGRLSAVEIVDAPQLSVVTYRLRRREGETLEGWNARNQAWHAATNARNRVFCSSTMLPGSEGPIFTLRVCILGFRTRRAEIERCLEDLRSSLDDPGVAG